MEGRRGGGNGDEAADKEGSAGHQCLLTHGLGGGHRAAREMGLRDVLPASALAPWPTPLLLTLCKPAQPNIQSKLERVYLAGCVTRTAYHIPSLLRARHDISRLLSAKASS